MTEDDRALLTDLANAASRAGDKYRYLGMLNTPTDPDKRREAAVAYAIAEAELLEAKAALIRVQQQIAAKA